jgi:hypothetical protein
MLLQGANRHQVLSTLVTCLRSSLSLISTLEQNVIEMDNAAVNIEVMQVADSAIVAAVSSRLTRVLHRPAQSVHSTSQNVHRTCC